MSFTYNGSNPELRGALQAGQGAFGSAARLVMGGGMPPTAEQQAALKEKFERERAKHGRALEKAHQVKEKRKKDETVKSWMELFVLLQEVRCFLVLKTTARARKTDAYAACRRTESTACTSSSK